MPEHRSVGGSAALAGAFPTGKTPLLGIALALLAVGVDGETAAGAATPPITWEPVGLSGGGGMFTPAISPADPNLMMLNCDMSAAYLSEDGGRNWRMIHHAQLRSDTALPPGVSSDRPGHPLRLLRRTAPRQPRPGQDLRADRQSAGNRWPAKSPSTRPIRRSCWPARAAAAAGCRATRA